MIFNVNLYLQYMQYMIYAVIYDSINHILHVLQVQIDIKNHLKTETNRPTLSRGGGVVF